MKFYASLFVSSKLESFLTCTHGVLALFEAVLLTTTFGFCVTGMWDFFADFDQQRFGHRADCFKVFDLKNSVTTPGDILETFAINVFSNTNSKYFSSMLFPSFSSSWNFVSIIGFTIRENYANLGSCFVVARLFGVEF